jgi:hypothetical protein
VTLSADLMEQARRLATLDSRRPKQANLRRAISTAYYALFHELVTDGAARVSRAGRNGAAWSLVTRKFEHATMDRVSKAIVAGTADWVRQASLHSARDVVAVADAFVSLQGERHAADYDLGVSFTRVRALEAIEKTNQAFDAWARARKTEAANYYLLALLLGPPRG